MSQTDSKAASDETGYGPGTRALAILGIAVAAGLAVWLVTAGNRDDDDPAVAGAAPGDSRIVPVSEAESLPGEAGHALYWAGEHEGMSLEYNDTGGNVHLRYLPEGTEAGSSDQTFLDVGTYPFKGAYKATRALAGEKGMKRIRYGDGVGFLDRSRPYSVTMAFPDQPNLQIEVYYPEENGALEIVRRGDIVPLP